MVRIMIHAPPNIGWIERSYSILEMMFKSNKLAFNKEHEKPFFFFFFGGAKFTLYCTDGIKFL